MDPTDLSTSALPRPRCHTCGEVLGVYEPLVVDHGDGAPACTSLLRLPRHLRILHAEALFHVACHALPPAAADPTVPHAQRHDR